MIDFITGWILGRNSNRWRKECNCYTVSIDSNKEKDYGYIPMNDLKGCSTSIEQAYKDYKKNGIVTINNGDDLDYYLELEIIEGTKYYGDDEIIFFI